MPWSQWIFLKSYRITYYQPVYTYEIQLVGVTAGFYIKRNKVFNLARAIKDTNNRLHKVDSCGSYRGQCAIYKAVSHYWSLSAK